eukprot:143429_1
MGNICRSAKNNLSSRQRPIHNTERSKPINNWDVNDVFEWLSRVDDGALEELARKFRTNKIRGSILHHMKEVQLVEMNVVLGDRILFEKRKIELFQKYNYIPTLHHELTEDNLNKLMDRDMMSTNAFEIDACSRCSGHSAHSSVHNNRDKVETNDPEIVNKHYWEPQHPPMPYKHPPMPYKHPPTVRNGANTCISHHITTDITCINTMETSKKEVAKSEDNINCSRGGDSDDNDELIDVSDLDYDSLANVDHKQLYNALIDQNIIFDSLMKVYSNEQQSYIDVASILTKHNLYFVSAQNYQIWQEFETRTKIAQLVKNEHQIIDKETAINLRVNLDIVDNEKFGILRRISKINSRILNFLMGRTNKEIQLNIILNENTMESLPSLFYLNKKDMVKDVNYVEIENVDIIESKYMDEFMTYVFDDIAWIDEEYKYNSKIVTLQNYQSNGVIDKLNQRKNSFCKMFCIKNHKTIKCSVYNGHKVESNHNHNRFIDFQNNICPYEIHLLDFTDLQNCFTLNNVTCELKSNNLRHEWITHLDYILHINECKNDCNFPNQNEKQFASRMDDFDDAKSEFTGNINFVFGEYLNYWALGYKNSVKPNYNTLKQELLQNKYATLTSKEYYKLYELCTKYSVQNIKAHDVGVNNKNFDVAKGSSITINHIISLKLYTDFGEITLEYKKHCRRYNKDEPLNILIRRNSEIAHWCRYLKESCTFYGQLMEKNMVVYTGLNAKLLFDSLQTHFECPISTTTEISVAQLFSDGDGIMLTLKRANPKTRFFDVSQLSQFSHEEERLFTGASLRICDIYIDCKHSDNFVSAIGMFEQIICGKFIDGGIEIQNKLYSLVSCVIEQITFVDTLQQTVAGCYHFLQQEEYDTDSIINDFIDRYQNQCSSNIAGKIMKRTSIVAAITFINDYKPLNQYIIELFKHFVNKIQSGNEIWVNFFELEKIKNIKLKNALQKYITTTSAKSVQQYEWHI